MSEPVSIQSRDYWVKTGLLETWVLIDPTGDGDAARAYFIAMNRVMESFG